MADCGDLDPAPPGSPYCNGGSRRPHLNWADRALLAALLSVIPKARRNLREYETQHNQHRPHRALDAAAPLKPLPEPGRS